MDLLDHLGPAAARQVHIEEDDVGLGREDRGHGRVDILALADDGAARTDLVAHPRPEHRVIVDDHHP